MCLNIKDYFVIFFFFNFVIFKFVLKDNELSKANTGTSLVVQWLRIRLPMQGTKV